MLKIANYIIMAMAAVVAVGASAQAADLYTPPQPQPPEVVYRDVSSGGWYLRGDLDYHWADLRGNEYTTYPNPATCGALCAPGDDFDTTDLKGALSIGGGVGYKINSYLRTDVTADYWFDADFTGNSSSSGPCAGGAACQSTDTSSMEALLFLANAYADLGTYQGVTPYVGAGIGGAHINWDDFTDQNGNTLAGSDNWRFAWALMAGASYCLTNNLDLDVGYRFTRIEGGRMFEYDSSVGVGPGFDHGMNVHEVRAGLRYTFGDNTGNGCGPQVASYEPPATYDEPVYK